MSDYQKYKESHLKAQKKYDDKNREKKREYDKKRWQERKAKYQELEQLQQENKELKEENEFLKSEIEEAKRIFKKYLEYINERDERIDKTIKYIESNNETLYTYEPDYDYEENMVDNYDISNYREDLLKILKEVE